MSLRSITARIAVAAAVALVSGNLLAEVKVPNVFGSHMVLQQQKPIQIWGSADPGEQVTVKIADASAQATANDAGQWRVSLSPMTAGGPHTISITGTNQITLEDILIGEVWICSGQSNMEMGVGASLNAKEEIAAADHPQIRFIMVPKTISPTPLNDVKAEWKVCSPETIGQGGWGGLSAAGYYFGRELQKNLNVPIGLVHSNWGGTRIEPWTTPDAFAKLPELKAIHEQVLTADPRSDVHKQKASEFIKTTESWLESARTAVEEEQAIPTMPTFPAGLTFKTESQTPTGLYNAMIHPFVPMSIRGAIWYQGESNSGEGMLYARKMQALINGWREVFRQEIPFYYVQIAPYEYGNTPSHVLPEFWVAQQAAMQIPNTGMISTVDIADLKDIHPKNKQEVGRRLALWALAKTYEKTGIEYSGPVFSKLTREDAKLRLNFDHVGGGLVSRDGKPLTWFEVIDEKTGGFVPAKAEIDGESVIIWADEVKNPVAVRFAWSKLAEPNLSNKAGLPALPFKAGEIPNRDAISFISEANEMKLVYDIDLAKLAKEIKYDVDNRASITGTPTRIAYMLELGDRSGGQKHVFVSMDAFTTDLSKIGIPSYASGAKFQQVVKNMNVVSNAPGVTNGTGIATGNIEFWPNNYGQGNNGNVPGASASVFDFGDQIGEPADGYGCMQVHNHGAKQTVFAINHWSNGEKADLGIGSNPGENPDWTFTANGGNYASKRLRVFVQVK